MTIEKNITCIVCPISCKILVKIDGTQLEIVEGNKCKRGIENEKNEAFDPRRMLTTSVRVNNGEWPLVSVKSSKPVPKEKLFFILKEIKRTAVNAPVKSGQIIIKNIANTDINIVATKTVLTKDVD